MAKHNKIDEEGSIISVNKDKTYGIQIPANRAYIAVYCRKKFREDTSIPYPDKKTGSMVYKIYKAGDFSDWELIFGPYQPNLASAITTIIKLCIADGIEAGEKIVNVPKLIDAKFEEIKTELKLIDWKGRTKSEEAAEK